MGDFQIKKQPKNMMLSLSVLVLAAEWQLIYWRNAGLKVCIA